MLKAMGTGLCATLFMGCAQVQDQPGHRPSISEGQPSLVTLHRCDTLHLSQQHSLKTYRPDPSNILEKPATPKWVVHLLEDLERSE